MNVIYFTTAQDTASFTEYLKLWKNPINLSNQTFHNKMIRSLGLTNHVDVVSIRPFSRKNCKVKKLDLREKNEGEIVWHYPKMGGGRLRTLLRLKRQINRFFKGFPRNAVIVTDTINPTVLYFSTYFANKYNLSIIGTCTDSPSNISGTSRAYTLLLLKLAHNLDGYIALTSGLNELFNEENKPAVIIEGIVEDVPATKVKNEYGKYILYSGALSERYGIYDFIEFFKKYIKGDIKLLLCGHHVDMARLNKEMEIDDRIIYLGNVPNADVISLEAGAYCNLNPRPFSEDLDRFSIPSKVLEYLNSGAPTISVKNTKLQKFFNTEAIWIKSNSEKDFVEGFQKINEFTASEIKLMTSRAKETVHKYYSLSAINSKLEGFLYLFARKHNDQ